MKFPKIDLKELNLEKRRNQRERMKFIEWYAEQIRAGKA